MAWGLSWFSRKKRGRDEETDCDRDAEHGPSTIGNKRGGSSPPATAVAMGRPREAPAAVKKVGKKVTFKSSGRPACSQQPGAELEAPAEPIPKRLHKKQQACMGLGGELAHKAAAAEPVPKRLLKKQQIGAEECSGGTARVEQQRPPRGSGRRKQPTPALVKPEHSNKKHLPASEKSRRQQRQQEEEAKRTEELSVPPSAQKQRAGSRRTEQQQQRGRHVSVADKRGSSRLHAGAAQAGADDGSPGPSNPQPEPVVEPPVPSGNEPPRTAGGGMKRVRSSWKIRPLFIDEKLRVFVEGRDDELLHFDGGEFYQWLAECKSGAANPEDGFCYPLVVQDQDMRTVLEIKPPGEAAKQEAHDAIGHGAKDGPITVPVVKELPTEQQPDAMLEAQPLAVAASPQSLPRLSPATSGAEPSTAAAAVAGREGDGGEEDLDPPYVRYLEPTPDEMDLQVEYDLDEEDEDWLELFNEKARKGKSRKARRQLTEEWMERLMDRMEKEYTHALQRNPEKWVVRQPPPGSLTDVPTITLPPIEEVFSLNDCMMAPGMHHYPNIIEAVYVYWKGKHTRAGSPLIQRLWYEPPWHRKKAAERLAEDEEGDGGPFLALDMPVLQNVRRRRLDTEEIRSRFSELRRDLDAARLLADQVRKREKLKKQELRLFQEEWTVRLAEIQAGKPVRLRNGQLHHPPPTLSSVARLRAAGTAVDVHGAGEEGPDGAAAVEDRAARLAARRTARAQAAAAVRKPTPHKSAAADKEAPPGAQRSHKKKKAIVIEDERREEDPADNDDDLSANTDAIEVAEDGHDATTPRGQRKAGRKAPAPRMQPQPQQKGAQRDEGRVVGKQQPAAGQQQPARAAGNKRLRNGKAMQAPPVQAAGDSSEGDNEVAHKENQAPARPAKRTRHDPPAAGSRGGGAAQQRQVQQPMQAAGGGSSRRGGSGGGAAGPAPAKPAVAKPLKESNGGSSGAGRRGAAGGRKATGPAARGGSPSPRRKARASKRNALASPGISKEVLALLAQTIHDVKAPGSRDAASRR